MFRDLRRHDLHGKKLASLATQKLRGGKAVGLSMWEPLEVLFGLFLGAIGEGGG